MPVRRPVGTTAIRWSSETSANRLAAAYPTTASSVSATR
jgi:hypothetical protein